MTKRKHPQQPPPTSTLTLHLGDDARGDLDRCRELIQKSGSCPTPLSLGAVVRLALRRTLLGLLGEKADWNNPSCPYAAEYWLVRMRQLQEEDAQQRAREQLARDYPAAIGPNQSDGPKRGGGT